MRALWDFVAGGSRVTPLGVTLAVVVTALGGRLGWGGSELALLYCGTLIATLVGAAFERS